MPVSLPHFAESTVRAYQQSVTPPFAPTAIVVNGDLAESSIGDVKIDIPALGHRYMPVGDPAALMEAAKMLAGAQAPVLVLDRCVRTQEGLANVVALAEALGAAVIDKGGRMNFPNRHPLNQSGRAKAVLAEADVVMGIETADLYGVIHSYVDRIHRSGRPLTRPGTKIISLTASELLIHANFQDFQRMQEADLAIVGDGESSLPLLLAAVRSVATTSSAMTDRVKKYADAAHDNLTRQREAATYAWDASPISVARICMEIYDKVQHEDWSLTAPSTFLSGWPTRLWNFTKAHQYSGESGGYGVGYASVASLGAALAHRDAGGGRIPVAVLGDGDLMCAPSILWTAAHHSIPILIVVHNNRAYHQELMHVQRMAARHGRGLENARVGTTITNPNIAFAKLADSMGVWSEGPIDDPNNLGPALARALAVVKSGKPALLDVISQPR